ncbi:hypothetical protein M1M88_00235 [Peptococcaceae bacterium]|nr:hypothetical protein [Peptococcaceae bacterium]
MLTPAFKEAIIKKRILSANLILVPIKLFMILSLAMIMILSESGNYQIPKILIL